MFARKGLFSSLGRPVVITTVAALALTALEPSLAFAGSAPSGNGQSAAPHGVINGVTDVSARRRVYRRGGGGAAAVAAFAGIVGTGLAIAAAQNRRDYYDNYDGYYGGGPVYYGGGPYYGGYGGYRGRRSELPYDVRGNADW
jgi:hypothetical protein